VRTLGRIFLIDRETALAHSKNTQPEQAQILEPAE